MGKGGEPMSIILKGIDLPDEKLMEMFESDNHICIGGNYYPLMIKDAIQIPKGHGDIKDEKEIIKRLEEKEKEPLYQHDTDDWWVGIIDAETEVNNAPTIMEAEK